MVYIFVSLLPWNSLAICDSCHQQGCSTLWLSPNICVLHVGTAEAAAKPSPAGTGELERLLLDPWRP